MRAAIHLGFKTKIRIDFLVGLAITLVCQATSATFTSHLTHYGAWTDASIATFQRFHLVVLQSGQYSPAQNEAQAIARLRTNGTKVLLYLSLGEDATTYDQAQPAKGNGSGPVHWNAATSTLVYENKGVASYYLDEWNAKGYDADSVNKVPDGIPDRQGDWGSCLVNAGDPAWQALILAEARRLMALGADGLFLDTPETANPWSGYGWTSQGMHDLIHQLRVAFPTGYLLLNRGLFFFDPDNALQYRWSPRADINGVLFESYYTGSNYPTDLGGDGKWRANPFFASNKAITAPRLNVEMNRPDSRGDVFHLDYVANPMTVVTDLPTVFQAIRQEAVVEQGWVPEINDRLLSSAPTAFLDNPTPVDRLPPVWKNTAGPMTETGAAPAPRPGVLKAIPGNGKVTLRWDVAVDQTGPVRYTIYYAKNAPLDFDQSMKITDVKTEMGSDYTDRTQTGADNGCPYEFTVTGLSNQMLYRFAVRAEDATVGVTPPSGRTGPGGGIEETNRIVVMAIPRDSTAFPILVDGSVNDWNALVGMPDSVGDGKSMDFVHLKVTDDWDHLYFDLQSAGNANPSQSVLLLNTDSRSATGDIVPVASGFRGADYKWDGGILFQYQDGAWEKIAATSTYQASGNHLEIRIAKADLGITQVTGIQLLALASDGGDRLPEQGISGFAYSFTHPLTTHLRQGRVNRISRLKHGTALLFWDLLGRLKIHRKGLYEPFLGSPEK